MTAPIDTTWTLDDRQTAIITMVKDWADWVNLTATEEQSRAMAEKVAKAEADAKAKEPPKPKAKGRRAAPTRAEKKTEDKEDREWEWCSGCGVTLTGRQMRAGQKCGC
jgi:uncharacterized protein YdaU (DUF1376 family)